MSKELLIRRARVVTTEGVLDGGWVRVQGARILGAGPAPAPRPSEGEHTLDLPGCFLLPGFVDVHVHGGGGGSYTSGDTAEILAAVRYHRRGGTTRTLASLVTAAVPDLLAAIGPLAELTEDGVIAGIHLEGPFLSPTRCGAQDPRFLLEPDPQLLGQLLLAARGTIRMVTLAPELPGAIELVQQAVGAGVIAAIGHSDATYEDASRAIAAGARVATHLWNGMRPMHHREPGIVGAALEHEEIVCELIADSYHVHPAALALSFRAAAGRVALVTDAISAAGAADGLYRLGPAKVRVEQGEAHLDGTTTIAGSTLSTGEAVRQAVLAGGVALGAASRASSLVPARLLGIDKETGSLEAGKVADLVVLEPDLRVAAVMCAGVWEREVDATRQPAGGPAGGAEP